MGREVRNGPVLAPELLNNGAAWRRQRRLAANSTWLCRRLLHLCSGESAAETP